MTSITEIDLMLRTVENASRLVNLLIEGSRASGDTTGYEILQPLPHGA